MDTKIQSLTDKIYQEGVEKGNQEAERIIQEAKKQEHDIIAKARAEAARILADANKNADELSENTHSELKLYASQALEALRNEIVSMISGKLVNASVSNMMADKEFLNQLMLVIAQEWVKKESIVISTSQSEELTSYFKVKAKELLDKSVRIEKINGKDTSFVISPSNGAYKISFGEEEFAAFFKDFLRPQLVNLLF